MVVIVTSPRYLFANESKMTSVTDAVATADTFAVTKIQPPVKNSYLVTQTPAPKPGASRFTQRCCPQARTD